MSKFLGASLACALALTAVSSVFADPTDASAPPAQAQAETSAPAAQPATPPAKTAQAAKKKAPSPDDVICKPDPETDSRLGGAKICMTRAEWKLHQN